MAAAPSERLDLDLEKELGGMTTYTPQLKQAVLHTCRMADLGVTTAYFSVIADDTYYITSPTLWLMAQSCHLCQQCHLFLQVDCDLISISDNPPPLLGRVHFFKLLGRLLIGTDLRHVVRSSTRT